MQIVTINKNDAGQRLDKFIAKAFPNMPKSMMYKFIRTKKINICFILFCLFVEIILNESVKLT